MLQITNELETTKLKVVTKQTQLGILKEATKLRDDREIIKNDMILKLEDTMKNQAPELLRVQEKFISNKTHNSVESDSLICLDSSVEQPREVIPMQVSVPNKVYR